MRHVTRDGKWQLLKSDVWKYFSKVEEKKVKCDKDLSYHRTTSNMRDHLLRTHPEQYKWSQENQLTLAPFQRKCSAATIHQLILDIVTMHLVLSKERVCGACSVTWSLITLRHRENMLLTFACTFLTLD